MIDDDKLSSSKEKKKNIMGSFSVH